MLGRLDDYFYDSGILYTIKLQGIYLIVRVLTGRNPTTYNEETGHRDTLHFDR